MAISLAFKRTMIWFNHHGEEDFCKGMVMTICCETREEADEISRQLGSQPIGRRQPIRWLAKRRFAALSIALGTDSASVDGRPVARAIAEALSSARAAVLGEDGPAVDRVEMKDFSHRFYEFHDRQTHRTNAEQAAWLLKEEAAARRLTPEARERAEESARFLERFAEQQAEAWRLARGRPSPLPSVIPRSEAAVEPSVGAEVAEAIDPIASARRIAADAAMRASIAANLTGLS